MDEFIEAIGFICFGLVVIAAVTLIGGLAFEGCTYNAFIKAHVKAPYCKTEVVSFADKEVEVKRCWKLVVVEDGVQDVGEEQKGK